MRCPRRLIAPNLSLAAAALAVALLAPAPRAAAATLQLAGPGGASVSLNGSFLGFLPLAEPLTLPPGQYDLACDMPGMIPFRQHLELGDAGDRRHITIHLMAYSRRTAVVSNLALAGLGPRYLGHGTRGLVYSVTEVGGLLLALRSEISRSNSQKEYLLALNAYDQAVNANDIAVLRAAADARYQDAKNAANLRDVGLTAAIGAVVVSMVDAWLSFDGVAAGAGALPQPAGTHVSALTDDSASPAFHSAVRLSF